ncbi:MAG: Ppx/GppA family phosphatase [Armatimonadetes bacterium]|nr:Ppx/GppA family phosphatase [Armatimonadota bacterium]
MTMALRRVAAIDAGTNSVLLLVADVDVATGKIEPVADESVIARLGKGVDASGQLDASAIQRSLEAVERFCETARSLGVQQIALVGTSALRDASNAAAFLEPAQALCQTRCHVISGDLEARMSWVSVTSDCSLGARYPLAIADVGGGSTEFASGVGPSPDYIQSVDVGAVRLTERHLQGDPPEPGELEAARTHARTELSHALSKRKAATLVGIGGTVVNLGCVAFGALNYEQVHGHRLSLKTISELIVSLASKTLHERRLTPGLEPERADVIVGGAVIFEALLTGMKLSEVTISVRGARYGIAMELAAGRWN